MKNCQTTQPAGLMAPLKNQIARFVEHYNYRRYHEKPTEDGIQAHELYPESTQYPCGKDRR